MSFREAIESITSSASEVGRSVDAIFWALTAVCGFMVLLLGVLILYFCIRYHRRSQAPRTLSGASQTPIEIAWVAIPLLIFLALFVWAGVVFFQMSSPPDDALEIHVVGKQWMWKIQHPDGRREINELHLPVGRPVVLLMISQDVIHSFYVRPSAPSRMCCPVAIRVRGLFQRRPGSIISSAPSIAARNTPAWWERCTCSSRRNTPVGWRGGRTQIGGRNRRTPFLSRGCAGCHVPGGPIRSPLLEGIFRKPVALANGTTIIADEAYLRDSILVPNQDVVAGYDPVMPTFQGQLARKSCNSSPISSRSPASRNNRHESRPQPDSAAASRFQARLPAG